MPFTSRFKLLSLTHLNMNQQKIEQNQLSKEILKLNARIEVNSSIDLKVCLSSTCDTELLKLLGSIPLNRNPDIYNYRLYIHDKMYHSINYLYSY
jgi:hypothetical protein